MTAGAVTSEHKLASQIGLDILRLGGSAADALVATVFAVNTLCCYDSDIGGSGFALVCEPGAKVYGLDCRGTAPAAVTMEQYLDKDTKFGGSAVIVPGQIKGLEELHLMHGRLAWDSLLHPSIKMAEEGIAVTPELLKYLKFTHDGSPFDLETSWLRQSPEFVKVFLASGTLPPIGSTYTRPDFARTLKMVAQRGSKGFYEGTVAEKLVRAVADHGGLMTLEDLKGYHINRVVPLKALYRDVQIYSMPAPASGAIFLSALTTLSFSPQPAVGTCEALHYLTESLRLAYAQRTTLGDPAFNPSVSTEEKSWFTAPLAAIRAKAITPQTREVEAYLKEKWCSKNDNGTSHVVATDEDGLTISMTTTVGLPFGSRIMVPGAGFILNDSMDDFSVRGKPNWMGYEPAPANYVHAGKRPMSSSCPYIVTNARGDVIAAGGAAGGSTIISTNVQVLRNILEYDMQAEQALLAPRLHNQLLPNVLHLETPNSYGQIPVTGFSEEQAKDLRERAHDVQWDECIIGTACVIRFISQREWDPAAEPRKTSSGAGAIA